MRKGLRRRAALPVATPFPLSQGLLRLRHEPARQRPDPGRRDVSEYEKASRIERSALLYRPCRGWSSGSHVMRLHQIPLSASLQNIGALLAGGLVSFLFLTLSAPRRARSGAMPGYAAMLLCAGALGCTFLDSGIGAIHRWIRLGPLALNAAFAFVPVALIGMDLLFRSGNRRGACALSLLTGVLLFLQPDASMSGAFAMAVLPALWHGDTDRALRRTVWGILTVLAVLSWAWLKSPEPVAQAEGILDAGQRIGDGLVADGPAVAGGAVLSVRGGHPQTARAPFLREEACCSTPG